MSSGISWSEDYGGRDDASRLWRAMFFRYGDDANRLLSANRVREVPAGKRFKYSGGETAVLCEVLAGATKKKVSALTEELIWKPMGAEADASWLVGRNDSEFCTGAFNATARDYARLGRLLADDGARDGMQIILKA